MPAADINRMILDRLDSLDREIKTLSTSVSGDVKTLTAAVASLEAKVVSKDEQAKLERRIRRDQAELRSECESNHDDHEKRIGALETSDAKRSGQLAGLSVAGGGAVAGLIEAIRRIFE